MPPQPPERLLRQEMLAAEPVLATAEQAPVLVASGQPRLTRVPPEAAEP
jgi:hypothetical protein